MDACGLAQWYVAGYLVGFRRALDDRDEPEFFLAAGRELLASANPRMRSVIETVTEGYFALPYEDRTMFTGPHTGLDVQLPLGLFEVAPPVPDAKRWFVQEIPEDGELKGVFIADDPLAPAGDTSDCCDQLILRLKSIHVEEETFDPGDDNVNVTALSYGEFMQPSPTPFTWMIDDEGIPTEFDMDTGDSEAIEAPMAIVKPGLNCRFSLVSKVTFWEIDLDRIDKLTRKATHDLIRALGQKNGVAGVPASVSTLIDEIFGRLLDLFHLRDDVMGSIQVNVSGRLLATPKVSRLAWSPAWGRHAGVEYVEEDAHNVVLKRRLERNEGIWNVAISLQRICPI